MECCNISKLIFCEILLRIYEKYECKDQEELHLARHRPTPVHTQFLVVEEIVDVKDVSIPKSGKIENVRFE